MQIQQQWVGQHHHLLSSTTSTSDQTSCSIRRQTLIQSSVSLRWPNTSSRWQSTATLAPQETVSNATEKLVCTLTAVYVTSLSGLIFSERDVRYMLSPVRLLSVCLSSVGCNISAPYSGGSNFRQYFYGNRYLGHWHPLKLLRRSSQGNPSAGGVKHKRGSQV